MMYLRAAVYSRNSTGRQKPNPGADQVEACGSAWKKDPVAG